MIDRRRVTAKRESRNKVGDTILQGSLEIQRQAGGFPPHIQDSWDLVLQVLKDGRLGIRHLTSGLSFGKNKKRNCKMPHTKHLEVYYYTVLRKPST